MKYKYVSAEMPSKRLDDWYQKILEENRGKTIVSHTEISINYSLVRVTFIFDDQLGEIFDSWAAMFDPNEKNLSS